MIKLTEFSHKRFCNKYIFHLDFSSFSLSVYRNPYISLKVFFKSFFTPQQFVLLKIDKGVNLPCEQRYFPSLRIFDHEKNICKVSIGCAQILYLPTIPIIGQRDSQSQGLKSHHCACICESRQNKFSRIHVIILPKNIEVDFFTKTLF